MVVTPTTILPESSPLGRDKVRDSKGRIVSLETLALQELDTKEVDGKAWVALQVKLLMRMSVRLCAVAIPTSIDRLLIYEKLMSAHLERGMRLFGLGEHAGRNTLILCIDPAVQERIATRAQAQPTPALPEPTPPA